MVINNLVELCGLKPAASVQAADFNPRGDSIFSMTISLGSCVNLEAENPPTMNQLRALHQSTGGAGSRAYVAESPLIKLAKVTELSFATLASRTSCPTR